MAQSGSPPESQPRGHASGVMARLTLSALERLSDDPNCWREPIVHRAVLVTGLSVLLRSLALVQDGAG